MAYYYKLQVYARNKEITVFPSLILENYKLYKVDYIIFKFFLFIYSYS